MEASLLIGALLTLVGLGALIEGASQLITGAEGIASKFGISPAIIGLLLVAMGTSLPELVVTTTAGFRGATGLAIEGVLGSNLSNLMLVLGLAALVRPLVIRRVTMTTEIPYSLAATLLVGFLANAHVLENQSTYPLLSRWDGIILLLFFALFLVYCFRSIRYVEVGENTMPEKCIHSVRRMWTYVVVGSILVGLGGAATVQGALTLATVFNVRDGIIGLTIIALGTSTPELAVSIIAALKGKVELAVCNVIGSNIINLLLVLGLASGLTELPFDPNSNQDIMVLIIATVFLLFIALFSRNPTVTKPTGFVLVAGYVCYIFFVVHSN